MINRCETESGIQVHLYKADEMNICILIFMCVFVSGRRSPHTAHRLSSFGILYAVILFESVLNSNDMKVV